MPDIVDKQKQGMVDVSQKAVTLRVARAQARIELGAKAFALLMEGASPKGDVLESAKVAGIMAAKSTPQLIPMCHPLQLSKVNIQFEVLDSQYAVRVVSEVAYEGKTGVEMEALTAASVAALTIYDMMKWADKGMKIKDVFLLEKRGGKSGDFRTDATNG